jgi:hypothetical protein
MKVSEHLDAWANRRLYIDFAGRLCYSSQVRLCTKSPPNFSSQFFSRLIIIAIVIEKEPLRGIYNPLPCIKPIASDTTIADSENYHPG